MFTINDWLDAFLLGAFFFGLIFSVATLIMGVADLGWGHAQHGHGGHDGHDGHDGPGPLNLVVILAFVTWFGGVAYLFRTGLGIPAVIALVVGLGGGLLCAWIVFKMMKLVHSQERVMKSEDYRLPGVIARVTSSIREGGTGEVVYIQGGVRQVAAARAVNGGAIPRGTEVVILRNEHGIVYVELWDDLVASHEKKQLADPVESQRGDL